MNYGDLTIAIRDYLQNNDSTFLDQMNTFILSAEDRVYRAVQMPAFWKSTTVGDIGSSTTITLPAGSIEVYDVRVSETANDEDGPWRYLLKKDWDFLLEAYPGDSSAVSTGIPKYYAVGAASTELIDPLEIDSTSNSTLSIEVAPKPSAADIKYSVDYYGKTSSESITSGSVTTNETWLSVAFPDVLLHGSVAEAYSFMKGDPNLLKHYEQQFAEGVMMMASVVTGKGPSIGQQPG